MEISNMNEEISFYEYTPDDHAGFVACINDFYRGGYPYDRYLNADYLKRKTADGSMTVTVAKNKEGRIVGTSAAQKLTGVFDGSILLLLRCVITEYQKRGIASRQEDFLFDIIGKRYGDALSLYADVMTHNDVSQKTLTRQGFTLCGLRMMLYKSEIMVPKLELEPGTKISQAVYCKAIKEKKVNIYAPSEHKEFIKNVYENLKVPYRFNQTDNNIKTAGKTGKYNVSEKPKHFSAEFYIERPAEDFNKSFLPTVNRYLANGCTCVAYINAEYAESLTVYETLKEIGFYFTGIKPLSIGGEYLILSHTKNCSLGYHFVTLYEKQFDLLNYIFGGKENEKQ